jgi:hypothetical protein
VQEGDTMDLIGNVRLRLGRDADLKKTSANEDQLGMNDVIGFAGTCYDSEWNKRPSPDAVKYGLGCEHA